MRIPLARLKPLPLETTKVIARRAAAELLPNSVVNLGIGLPNSVSSVAAEEQIEDLITLTVDPGVIGGVPLGGLDFGASVNFSASVDHPYQFDFIDGGGLDISCLGYAECDGLGNVNASRFANRIPGCGGFINISQNSRKVIFVGTFTSGGLEAVAAEGRLEIRKEGKHRKFVEKVGQITFSGVEAAKRGQEVLYVTERCVFGLTAKGLELDGGRARCRHAAGHPRPASPLRPIVGQVRDMEPRLFAAPLLGLRDRLLDLRIEDRLSYDPASNTVFMNYSGMRVRTKADLDRIKVAVDGLLGPLNKKVYSIVNYDRFEADADVMHDYLDSGEVRGGKVLHRRCGGGLARSNLPHLGEQFRIHRHTFARRLLAQRDAARAGQARIAVTLDHACQRAPCDPRTRPRRRRLPDRWR